MVLGWREWLLGFTCNILSYRLSLQKKTRLQKCLLLQVFNMSQTESLFLEAMQIESSVEYNSSSKSMLGDVTSSNSTAGATHVLVFMLGDKQNKKQF